MNISMIHKLLYILPQQNNNDSDYTILIVLQRVSNSEKEIGKMEFNLIQFIWIASFTIQLSLK